MTTLKTLLVQAELCWRNPERNRRHLSALLAEAEEPFDLAVFPETFTTGFLGDADVTKEGMDGPTVAWMRELASQYSAAIAGSAVIVEDGLRYNRFLFVRPDGSLEYYDKRHLFSFAGEHRRYTGGERRVIVDYLGWRINLQVCYDLRFPAWCRNRDDYDLMLLVANWPSKRVGHWSLLLEARSIENQAWVIGVNRVGEDGKGIPYPGSSVVHDPMGECVARLDGVEQLRRVDLELDRVREVREQFPFLADADRFEIET
jgi:predicted amidohydrolase